MIADEDIQCPFFVLLWITNEETVSSSLKGQIYSSNLLII